MIGWNKKRVNVNAFNFTYSGVLFPNHWVKFIILAYQIFQVRQISFDIGEFRSKRCETTDRNHQTIWLRVITGPPSQKCKKTSIGRTYTKPKAEHQLQHNILYVLLNNSCFCAKIKLNSRKKDK